jgi:hypothetical protein
MKRFEGTDLASIEAVSPDIECVVSVGELEIAVIGLFQNKRDVWDILVGVDDVDRVEQLVAVFTAILVALPAATFGEVRSTGSPSEIQLGLPNL